MCSQRLVRIVVIFNSGSFTKYIARIQVVYTFTKFFFEPEAMDLSVILAFN